MVAPPKKRFLISNKSRFCTGYTQHNNIWLTVTRRITLGFTFKDSFLHLNHWSVNLAGNGSRQPPSQHSNFLLSDFRDMIHLDRDRNELSSDHLILSEDHNAFSWVDIPHDDNYLTSLSHLNTPEHLHANNTDVDSTQGQNKNPSSPPHATDDKSSSLSPPPEYPPPQIQRKNSPLPPQQEKPVANQSEANLDDDGDGDGDGSYSRQLTPLTDLSAVADGDESLDFEKKDSTTGETEGHGAIAGENGDTKGATDNVENRWAEKHGSTSPSSPTRHVVPIPGPHQPLPIAGPSQYNQRLGPFAGPSHSRRPSSQDMISTSQLPSPNISAAKLSGGDSKVARILEINSELLKYVRPSLLQPPS